MKVGIKAAIASWLFIAVAAVPAAAQSWKWDFNVNAGYSAFNKIISEDNTGLATADGSDIKFKNGGFLGSQLTFWPSSRLGIRFNGTFADRPLIAEGFSISTPANGGLSHVNLWGLTGDLMLRLARPADEFTKMEILPYLALGAGVKWHNPTGDSYTCNDTSEGKTFSCAPFTIQGGNSFALGEANTLMGLVGLGADWRFSRSFALRTEIGDRIWDARLFQVTPPITGTTFALTQSDEDVGDAVHELYAQAGLTFLFGTARPTTVAIAAPVAPAPEPAPTPTVSREAISVCVVDPTATTGLRMQSAFLVGGRDTVVTVTGSDQPLSSSLGNVAVVSNADWYVRGQPFTVTAGTQKFEYVTYGSARVIESSDLAYLGTVNGMPVYADRNEVKDIIGEIDELRASNNDLGKILGEHKTLRTSFGNVKVLYVPMESSGCVFQAVQLQEDVRKGK